MRPGRAVSALRTPQRPPAPTILIPVGTPQLNMPQRTMLKEAASANGMYAPEGKKTQTAKVLQRKKLVKLRGGRLQVTELGFETAMAYAEAERPR